MKSVSLENLELNEPIVESDPVDVPSRKVIEKYSMQHSQALNDSDRKVLEETKKYGGSKHPLEGVRP